MSKLVRISDTSYSKLDLIAKSTGYSRQDLIDKAILNLERDIILKKANEAYAQLKNNPQLWQEEQEERQLNDV